MNCGIYIITNKVNNKVYIGSSQDIKRRFYLHRHYLNKKKHVNMHLQTAWDLYGEESFVFSVLETLNDKESLLQKEKYYIELYQSTDRNKGYNICEDTSAPMRNRKHSAKSIEKMKKSKIGESNNFFGKNHTDQTKEKIRKAKTGKKLSDEHKEKIASKSHFRNGENHIKSKLSFEEVQKIRQQFEQTEKKHKFCSQIAKEYCVHSSTIRRIIENKSYLIEDNNDN
ncbi:hypothetical protein EBU94_06605 [bacterium]|nr:hypothetical protein [bacterium]